jgi:hypothetical protein
MNQVLKIGTVRLSAGGFFVLFLFYCTQTMSTKISVICFLTFLKLLARKLFCAKNICEAFGPVAYTPEVTPTGLFVNYPSFLPDLDET